MKQFAEFVIKQTKYRVLITGSDCSLDKMTDDVTLKPPICFALDNTLGNERKEKRSQPSRFL